MRVTEQSSFRGPEAQRLADQGPSQASRSARKLPAAPRERKPALAALAVLLIVGGALLAAFLVIKMSDRVSAIAITRPVNAGQQIKMEDLKEVQVPREGDVPYAKWADAAQAVGTFAKMDLIPNSLLLPEMTTTSSGLTVGKAVVGLSLKAGQVPGGIQTGQRVQVIFVPGDDGAVNAGKVLAERALVHSVGTAGTSGSGNTMVDIVVDKNSAASISAFASAGRIALAYLPGVKGDQAPVPSASGTPEPTTSPVEPTAVPTNKGKKPSSTPTATQGG